MEVSELVRSLLAKRGVESDEHIAAFLSPDYDAHTHDPALLNDMRSALGRLFAALGAGERIAIYADYDCDGVSGAAVLSDFFGKIGYTNVEVYLPHRDREGYGFHAAAARALAERGVKLIITADVGTTAVEAARAAKDAGADVIVTDHHEVMGAAPGCVAVVNPKLGGYPFSHLCGAGVAFKLVQAALREGKRRRLPQFLAVPEGWEKWLLDIVALATIADMVPLTGENRALTHWGLQVLRKSPRPGIASLCEYARIRQRALSEEDVGFSLTPRINAASRMGEPETAFRLLTTKRIDEARALAAHLEKLNNERKGLVASIVKEAKKRARERYAPGELVTVLGDTSWKPALLGLVANSVLNERGGLVCLWGRDAEGRLKGSCRSDGSLSLSDVFANTGDLFEQYGGHAHSGGFTVSPEKVHLLPEHLARASARIERVPRGESAPHDASLPLRSISLSVLEDVTRLSPFGVGNPKPVFLVPEARVVSVRRFGRERNHVELTLGSDETGFSVRAFEYFKSPEHFSLSPSPGIAANVLATLERDTFRGEGALALRLVDVLPLQC